MSKNAVQISTTDPDVTELVNIHGRVAERITATLTDAIRAGEILTRRRAEFPLRATSPELGFAHWVKQNLPFSERTAYGYINAYENRNTLLANPDATIRQLMGNKPKTTTTTGDGSTNDKQRTTRDGLNKRDEIITLTDKQNKRAQRIADYFGVELIDAQRYVRDTAPRPRATTGATTNPDEPQLAKRTIRVTPDHDDLIHRIARTTNRSYAVVANELFDIGRTRFIRRYNLNIPD